jgi:hypothetical protein
MQISVCRFVICLTEGITVLVELFKEFRLVRSKMGSYFDYVFHIKLLAAARDEKLRGINRIRRITTNAVYTPVSLGG